MNNDQAVTRRVVSLGNFDGVHRGHQRILHQLRELGRRLGAAPTVLTFVPHSASVLRPGARVPLLTLPEEKRHLLGRYGVDDVQFLQFDADLARLSPREFWERIIAPQFQPAGVVAGYDHRFGRDQEGSPETLAGLCRAQGLPYEIVEACADGQAAISSTRIRQLVTAGSMAEANRLLGHAYLLQGEVVRGQGLGRQLGTPTANLHFSSPDKLLPGDGVYACRVQDGGREYPASLYVGARPTVDGGETRAEAHLLHQDRDLYGRTIRLELDAWVRPSQTFAGAPALQAQIQKDLQHIEEYYKTKSQQKG